MYRQNMGFKVLTFLGSKHGVPSLSLFEEEKVGSKHIKVWTKNNKNIGFQENSQYFWLKSGQNRHKL
jgi:hypothetical protein